MYQTRGLKKLICAGRGYCCSDPVSFQSSSTLLRISVFSYFFGSNEIIFGFCVVISSSSINNGGGGVAQTSHARDRP
jgi:hypothetical protein